MEREFKVVKTKLMPDIYEGKVYKVVIIYLFM